MTSAPLPLGSASSPEVIEQSFAAATEHFLNSVSEAFALIDQDGRVIRANIAYRRLTGPAGGAAMISFATEDAKKAGVFKFMQYMASAKI